MRISTYLKSMLFPYVENEDLDSLTDLKLIEYWVSDDVRPDHANEKWLNTLWRSI